MLLGRQWAPLEAQLVQITEVTRNIIASIDIGFTSRGKPWKILEKTIDDLALLTNKLPVLMKECADR